MSGRAEGRADRDDPRVDVPVELRGLLGAALARAFAREEPFGADPRGAGKS